MEKIIPKISIIIPVYNAEKYIAKCLDSIINQTYKNIEILCINDGSKDNSLSILNEYSKKDKRIKVFSQKNSGPAKARNLGLETATGEYLWFVDADDSIPTNALCVAIEIIEKETPDIISFATNVYHANGKSITKDKTRNLTNIPNLYINKNICIDDFKNIFEQIPTEAWNKIFNKKFITQNKIIFNEKLYGMDDGFFTQETFIKAKKIYITKERLYNYTIYNTNSVVSYLINVNLKNYKYSINYSKHSLKLAKELLSDQAIIQSLLNKNIQRMFFYLQRARGICKSLYRITLKKHLKEIIKSYPFIMEDEKLTQQINNILKHKFIKLNKITKIFFDKKTERKNNGYYLIKKTKFKLLGIKLTYTKKEINWESYSKNIVTKVSRLQTAFFIHQKTFAGFKNCNNGKTIVFVGAGPTVSNYNIIEDAKHLALNRAILRKDISFDYFFTFDKIGIENFKKDIIEYNDKCIKFIGDINNGIDYQISESDFLKMNARKFITTTKAMYNKYSLNIESEPLMSGHSIAYPAIQFALYTNPKRIYLVGIDCGNAGKHFAGKEHNVEDRGENIENLQKTQINEWKQLKEFAQIYYPDTEIISINPVGLKGVFNDVYTQTYIDEHPELLNENIEVI